MKTKNETKIDEAMEQLLENEEKYQEAAQGALFNLLDTESFTYRIDSKIVGNPNVYSHTTSINPSSRPQLDKTAK